ncbi:MAG: class I SAM-dependent methyltransferase [Planctomycetes bacterium]|nr:class I SAM-dependent methyltransferase [Planctomycetota bacterium]
MNDTELGDSRRLANITAWLDRDLGGCRVLCLAAGGGRHGVLYAQAGAEVTVVDISPEMLRVDREVTAARGLNVRTIQASMDAMPMLRDGEFDLVVQPVSTCYVSDVASVYAEVARVLANGALYISQHKTPASMQADVTPSPSGYELIEPYYRSGPLPDVAESPHREQGMREYLHRWEQLIGSLCRAGFVIEDLMEPIHSEPKAPTGSFAHRCCFVAPYVRIKARRIGRQIEASRQSGIWVP